MNNFSWSKALGFGALIWAVMFAITSAFVGFGFNMNSMLWSLITAGVSGVLAYFFSGYIKTFGSWQALGYGLSWVIVGVTLDLIITRQFNSAIFGTWEYSVGYALVLFAPWLKLAANPGTRVTESGLKSLD